MPTAAPGAADPARMRRYRRGMIWFWSLFAVLMITQTGARSWLPSPIEGAYESPMRFAGTPVFAYGDHPRAIVAVGRFPVGVIAVGGLSIGVIAVGGVAAGAIAISGVSLGILAFGGLAAGWWAVGGGAFGYYAFGGLAVGGYAYAGGGVALGYHSASGMQKEKLWG